MRTILSDCTDRLRRRISAGAFIALLFWPALAFAALTPLGAPQPAAPLTSQDPQLGVPGARTTLIVWFDYQCPYCKLFWRDVLPRLNATYVRQKKLRIVFKDFQFLGQDSATAALFARAVWELYPARYYDWTRAMFDAQDQENGGFGNLASIVELTRHVPGIDVARVTATMRDHAQLYATQIEADYNEGLAAGVQGTPTVAVNGSQLVGSASFEDLAKLIDAKPKH